MGYAGVDAPGCALNMIAEQLSTLMDDGSGPARIRIVYAVEKWKPSQKELLLSPHAPEHLYTDYELFWLPEIRATINRLKKRGSVVDFNSLLPLILSGRSVGLVAHCMVCDGPCKFGHVDLEIAGVSCLPWTPMGTRQETNATDMIAMASWAATVRQRRPKVIIFENSHKFRKSILEAMLGDFYFVMDLLLEGTYFGWPGRRPRYYATCVSMKHMLSITSHFGNVIRIFHRICRVDFKVFFVANTVDRLQAMLDEELVWARGRPTSKFQFIDREPEDETIPEAAARPYYDALTLSEHTFYKEYEAAQVIDRVIQLNQSPARGRGIQSGKRDLHSLVSSAATHYFKSTTDGVDIDRWMSAFEMLFAQGFPIMNRLSNPSGGIVRTCSFGEYEEEPRRIRNHVVQQAGNSMQLVVVGAVLLYVLMFVKVGSYDDDYTIDHNGEQKSPPLKDGRNQKRPFSADPFVSWVKDHVRRV